MFLDCRLELVGQVRYRNIPVLPFLPAKLRNLAPLKMLGMS